MSEKISQVSGELSTIWRNLSFQMQAHIKAFGIESKPLKRLDFTPEEWRNLSPQIRARIISSHSMEESRKTGL